MHKFIIVKDFQENAKSKLEPNVFEYYRSGSDDEVTLRENELVFSKVFINPRVLVDVSPNKLNLSTRLLGHTMAKPFGFAPSAMQRLAHPDGELISAKVAKAHKVCLTLSTLSTVSLKQIEEANRGGLRLLQMYINKDREITEALISLAEKYKFGGLVITVDAQVLGKRLNDARTGFTSPPGTKFELLDQVSEILERSKIKQGQVVEGKQRDNKDRKSFLQNRDRSLDWKFVKWIKSVTNLPIVLKGILSPLDALLAVENGVDAVWVSNHGGRQLDTVPSTLQALESISSTLTKQKKSIELYVDGGIRQGSDVFKCLALGANYVFLGRPLVFSLVQGQQGVQRMMQILTNQLQSTMCMAGVTDVKNIDRRYIVQNPSKL